MIYVFDGAMGTMLQEAGLPAGYCPELWNIENPQAITAVHKMYVTAGADIIETNTLGANRIKLEHYGLAAKAAALNTAAVRAAQAACGPQTLIAGSVGSTGKFIAPLGELDFDAACAAYREQIAALDQAGADMIIIETIIDIQEMRAALIAAREVSKKPVICQLTYGADGRTVTGTNPQTAALTLEALGADVIGVNCSLGPAQLLPIVAEIAANCRVPVSAQPNAGMPELRDGKTIFPMGPEEMAVWAPKLAAAGATYIGGCCGTTPEHIRAIRQALTGVLPGPRPAVLPTALTSRTRSVLVGAGLPTAIIGERINPTGRKAMAAEILKGNFVSVKKEALEQVRAGAHILDVNMGVPGIDQAAAMHRAVSELSMLVETPLAIDTTDPQALETGLKLFPGRALVNSVSAEPERIQAFLPLAKKYGAAVLCLPIAPGGVPATAAERAAIAGSIVSAALAAGLRTHDLLLDPLVLTVAADRQAALETLATLRLYRQKFGCPTVMGLSNISYGLPRRDVMNAAFCAMALAAGLDAPILNPYDPAIGNAFAAAQALLGHDPGGRSYSVSFAAEPASQSVPPAATPADVLSQIKQAVISGEKEAISALIKQALAEGTAPLAITDNALTAAMNDLGLAFAQGRCFLPQVMLAAETMRAAFETIKETLPAHRTESKGTVILATVKGDIHDLGKNIVAALLENSGFTVVDLGKDVSPAAIVEAAQKQNPHIVGLCALMTTTMPQIDTTIKALKAAKIAVKTIVGGAVLTEDYARQAGADAYAANGVEAVRIAKELVKN